jgi:hypothetical protein
VEVQEPVVAQFQRPNGMIPAHLAHAGGLGAYCQKAVACTPFLGQTFRNSCPSHFTAAVQSRGSVSGSAANESPASAARHALAGRGARRPGAKRPAHQASGGSCWPAALMERGGMRSPMTLMDWGVSPTWPITATPASTIARAASTRAGLPPARRAGTCCATSANRPRGVGCSIGRAATWRDSVLVRAPTLVGTPRTPRPVACTT